MILQPLTTLIRSSSVSLSGSIIQPQQNWLNVGRARRLVLVTEVFKSTGDAALTFQTSENPTAEWYDSGGVGASAGGVGTIVLSRGVPLSQAAQLRQYVRWSFFASSAGDELTFRIRYTIN